MQDTPPTILTNEHPDVGVGTAIHALDHRSRGSGAPAEYQIAGRPLCLLRYHRMGNRGHIQSGTGGAGVHRQPRQTGDHSQCRGQGAEFEDGTVGRHYLTVSFQPSLVLMAAELSSFVFPDLHTRVNFK